MNNIINVVLSIITFIGQCWKPWIEWSSRKERIHCKSEICSENIVKIVANLYNTLLISSNSFLAMFRVTQVRLEIPEMMGIQANRGLMEMMVPEATLEDLGPLVSPVRLVEMESLVLL